MQSTISGAKLVEDPDHGVGVHAVFGYRFAPRLSGALGFRNTWMQTNVPYRISELDGALSVGLGPARGRISPFVELSVSRQSIIQSDLVSCATDGSVCFRTTGETIGRAVGAAAGLSWFVRPRMSLTATAGQSWSTFSSLRFAGQKQAVDYAGQSRRVQLGLVWYPRPDSED